MKKPLGLIIKINVTRLTGLTTQGWLPTNHPDQIRGKEKDRLRCHSPPVAFILALLRNFANYFNKALNYRQVTNVLSMVLEFGLKFLVKT